MRCARPGRLQARHHRLAAAIKTGNDLLELLPSDPPPKAGTTNPRRWHSWFDALHRDPHNAAERPFMNLTTCFRVLLIQGDKQDQQGTTEMRNLILGAASALALASPAVASDLPVTSYSESYARSYEYRTSPPVVVEESAPVVSETLVVRRPVIVAPPRVVVEDYPVYATPRVYAAPRVYAYEGPGWRGGWGHRRHFYGGW
jgi:hypothetical protein